jgi:histidine triad (HIT) family protein
MAESHECIFCAVVSKKIPARVISESDTIMAFHDINPAAPIHILIIPKKHIRSLNNISIEDKLVVAEILYSAQELIKKYNNVGYRVVINTESSAGQSVFHLHAHLLAGRDFSWPPG